jgi:hypothetical protein
MPKVKITDKKGLVQSSGRGLVIESLGGVTFRGAGQCAATAGKVGSPQVVSFHKSSGDTGKAGIHIYQEEVSLVGAINATDSGVICELSKTLPANAKILKAALTVTTLSDLAAVDVQLVMSATAATAQGTVVGTGTVILGAGGAAEGSGALGCDASDTLGDTEVRLPSVGEYIDIAALTSLYVASDGTSNTASTATTGRVMVTIEYAGSAAPA